MPCPAERRPFLALVPQQGFQLRRFHRLGQVQVEPGTDVLSLHHDIRTATGEEVILFTPVASPKFREAK